MTKGTHGPCVNSPGDAHRCCWYPSLLAPIAGCVRTARKQASHENTTAIPRLTPLGKRGLFRPGKDAQGLAQRDAESSGRLGSAQACPHPFKSQGCS